MIGSPFLLPDLAALRALVDSEASLWKKCPGSVERDILMTLHVLQYSVQYLIVGSSYVLQVVLYAYGGGCVVLQGST
jgi:hypothetical protein